MLFVDLVIAKLDNDEFSWDCPWKPRNFGDLLFSLNYNENWCNNLETWYIVRYEGILFAHITLVRKGNDIKLTRNEKKRLTKAYHAAIKRQRSKWVAQRERNRFV